MSDRSLARHPLQDQLQGFFSSSQKTTECSWSLYILPEEHLESVESNDWIAANCAFGKCHFLV
jgi:hypothetical protein